MFYFPNIILIRCSVSDLDSSLEVSIIDSPSSIWEQMRGTIGSVQGGALLLILINAVFSHSTCISYQATRLVSGQAD